MAQGIRSRFFRRGRPGEHTSISGLRTIQVPLTSLRVHDAVATNLPGTAANDDMGIVGTGASVAVTLQGVDFGGTTSDEKSMFEFCLPDTYKDGDAVTVRVKAGMLTAVSDGTATVDCEVFRDVGGGTISADLCTTAAQSINSLTLADKSFTITPTTLVAGDRLFVKLSFAGSDTGNLAVMIPTITRIQILLGDVLAI